MTNKVAIKNMKQAAIKALLMSCLLSSSTAHAIPFPMFDARTAAIGGTNISHGIRNAAYYNPALAALDAEGYDWYIVAPGQGEFIADPDDMEDGVKDLVNGSGNATDILNRINNKIYQKYEYNVLQFTIPTPFLGGAAYFADYEFKTEKVLNNNELAHQAVSIFETGVTVAQLQDVLWAENVLVGATVKLMLIESYGYREPIATADFDLDSDQLDRDSVLNVDVGMSKEYGVWKTALVVKNLFNRDHKYGNSEEKFNFEPQARFGLAYESRRAIFEFDLDLTKNEGIGYASDTMFAAVGWDWKIFKAFNLRLGYQQNLVGDSNATFSGGIGLKFWGLLLDFSGSANEDGNGTYLQASWQL